MEKFSDWFIIKAPINIVNITSTSLYIHDYVEEWLNENCTNIWHHGIVCYGTYTDIWFKDIHDAMAFKLRWL